MAQTKPRLIEFDKFLIIECSRKQIIEATGGPGICDHCSSPALTGYYIAVLNHWVCPECFENWKGYAQWYPEDADIERRNFEFYANRFGLKC